MLLTFPLDAARDPDALLDSGVNIDPYEYPGGGAFPPMQYGGDGTPASDFNMRSPNVGPYEQAPIDAFGSVPTTQVNAAQGTHGETANYAPMGQAGSAYASPDFSGASQGLTTPDSDLGIYPGTSAGE